MSNSDLFRRHVLVAATQAIHARKSAQAARMDRLMSYVEEKRRPRLERIMKWVGIVPAWRVELAKDIISDVWQCNPLDEPTCSPDDLMEEISKIYQALRM